MINSPLKMSGKTTLFDLLAKLVPKPWATSNPTPASVFHVIERHHPTMLFDEADTYIFNNNEFRGIVDSGHSRVGAYVERVKGTYSTWAPKVIALIGRMHPTLESRSIRVELKKKLPAEEVTPIHGAANAYLDLHRRCRRFAEDHRKELRAANQDADPIVPRKLHNRARDNWLPLLAIAEICGRKWPKKARRAALKLSAIDDDQEPAILLLQDLYKLFEAERGRHLSSQAVTLRDC